jgi:hypothetical protein
MADSGEIPSKLTPALRAAIWGAFPFIFFLVGVDRIFAPDGSISQVLICFASSILSVLLVVYWDRILPQRLHPPGPMRLGYLHTEDAELGSAIREMVWCSAWGKWFPSQSLAVGAKVDERTVMGAATHLVLDALTDGHLQARGRKPGQMDYEAIPQTHWRSTALYMTPDSRSLWKMILVPRGGAEIHPNGTVVGRDPAAVKRTAQLQAYDSIIVSGRQFEKLWPLENARTDALRKGNLKKARQAGADPAEIAKLARDPITAPPPHRTTIRFAWVGLIVTIMFAGRFGRI